MSHHAEENCSHMTTKEIKEELDKLNISHEGCLERSEIVRLYQEVQQKSCKDRGQGSEGKSRNQQSDSDGSGDVFKFLNNSMDFIGQGMNRLLTSVNQKFDVLDNKLKGLEDKKSEVKEMLNKEPKTALGRLQQLKTSAAVREFEDALQDTIRDSQEQRTHIKNELQQAKPSPPQ